LLIKQEKHTNFFSLDQLSEKCPGKTRSTVKPAQLRLPSTSEEIHNFGPRTKSFGNDQRVFQILKPQKGIRSKSL